MRFLFLSDARSFHTKRWVDYFVDRGYELYLVSLEKSLGTKAYEILISSKTIFPFLRYIFALTEVRKLIRELNPDLVNAHFIPNYGLLGALSKRKPLVVSTWGSDVLISPRKSFFHKLRAKYVLSKADLVTCDGINLAEKLNELRVEKGDIVFAPMGVEEKLIKERKDHFKEKEEIIILSTRSLQPIYDLKTLIKAIPYIVKDSSKKPRFQIIGEGSQKEELKRLSAKLGIDENIEFKGYIPRVELENCLEEADIYISTSLSDSTSVSLLEAMASGLVPVVSDIPGNREWIKDGETGFLFPKGDFQALAQKIVWIINNFQGIERLRTENQGLVREKALWEENMKIIEGRFLELLNK